MRVFNVAIASSLLTFAAAQLTIQVGGTASTPGGIFQFIPAQVKATKGTIVSFVFNTGPGNHSVTQSTFDDPCDPMENGFDSGWVLIPDQNALNNVEPPTFNVNITDDTELMVGAINAPESGPQSFEAFSRKAENFSGIPGQGQGGLVGPGASATGLPSPIPTSGGITLFTGSPLGGPASTIVA